MTLENKTNLIYNVVAGIYKYRNNKESIEQL